MYQSYFFVQEHISVCAWVAGVILSIWLIHHVVDLLVKVYVFLGQPRNEGDDDIITVEDFFMHGKYPGNDI